MVTSVRSPRPGDHVEIDWGLGTVLGVVEEVRRTGPRSHVLVRVDVLGPNGEVLQQQTVSVPAETVHVLAH